MRMHLRSSRVRLTIGLAAVSSILFAIHCGSESGSEFTPGGGCSGLLAAECGKACTADVQCAAGLHCGGDQKCNAECAQGSTCANGFKCSPRGRCGNDPGGTIFDPNDPGRDSSTEDPGGGDSCADINVTLEKTVPTVLFLIDRSSSMTDNQFPPGSGVTRWAVVKEAFLGDAGVIKKLESDVNFGLATYSWSGSGTCPRINDVDFAINNYEAINDLLGPANTINNTPTAQSIMHVVGFNDAGTLRSDRFAAYDAGGGRKIMILATDGDPDSCEDPNSNGSDPPRLHTVWAAARSFDAGITTYVMAVGADGDNEHQQQVANVGQGHPPTGPVDVTVYRPQNLQQMVDDLTQIVTGVRSCIFTLNGSVPAGKESLGVVELNGTRLTYNDPNGWKLNSPKELEVTGTACTTVKTQIDAQLTVRFPCGAINVDPGVN